MREVFNECSNQLHELHVNKRHLRQLQIGAMFGSQEPARWAGLHVPNPRRPEFSTLESRLNSFVGWPVAGVRVTAQTMSECGFFYIGTGDQVRCFQCGLFMMLWQPEDDPLSAHRNFSPNCAFLAALGPREGGEAGYLDLQAPGGDIGENVSSARPANHALDLAHFGVTVNEAAGDPTVNTSPAGSQTTDTNASGSAQTLSSPWATSQSYARSASPISTYSSPAETRDKIISVPGEQEHTPMVQAVLDMGYSLDVVNRVRQAKRQRNGADFTDAASLLGAILDDEKQAIMSDSASSSNPSPTQTTTQPGRDSIRSLQGQHPPPELPSMRAILTTSSRTPSDSTSIHPSHSSDDTSAQPQPPSAGASAQPDPPEASASAQPRLLRTTRPRQCQLCGQAEINVTFLPCGHFISCRSCAPKCSTCPKCNRTIFGTVKTYFA